MSVSVEEAPVTTTPARERPARTRPSRIVPDRWGLLVLPGAAFLLVCFAYPAAVLLAATFRDFIAPQVGGADNLAWFFGEPANLAVLRRTVVTAVVVTVLCAATGFPYAYLLTLVGRRLRLILIGVVVASFLGSLLVRSFSWLILFQRNGPLNVLLDAVGLPPLAISGTQTAVAVAMTQILVPLVILSVYATLQGVDRRLMTAAQSLGARRSETFFRVFVPLSAPGLVGGGFMVFVLTLGFYVTPTLVGSTQNALLSSFTVTQVARLAAFGRAGAISLVLIVLTLAFLALVAVVARRRLDAGPQQGAGGVVEERWSAGRRAGWGLYGTLMVLWLTVPSLVVVPLSFTERTSFAWPPTGFTLQWYETLFTDELWTFSIANTLKVAALTVVVCVVVGTAAALAIVRSRTPWVNATGALFYAPTIMPLVVTGVGLYTVFLQWHIVGTTLGFVIAHAVAALPFVVIVMMGSVRAMDRRLEDAATSLGAGPLDRFRSVTLPGILPGLLTAGFLAFAFSFDETVFSLFIATPDLLTLPVQTYQGVIRATDPTVTAASTLMFVVTVVGVVVALVAQGKDRRAAL